MPSLTTSLVEKLDIPVWEWMRFTPVASSALSSFTTSKTKTDRYIYANFGASSFWRYDTISDSWQELASPIQSIGVVTGNICHLKQKSYGGFIAQVIGTHAIGASTLKCAGLGGNFLVGKTVRVISGAGKGQERTISSVTTETIHDSGGASSGTTGTLVDSAKSWTINQYRGYQINIDNMSASGSTVKRVILYNNATTITFADTAWFPVKIRSSGLSPSSIAAGANYTIESTTFAVSSPWTVALDETSNVMFVGEEVYCISSSTSNYFYIYQVYSTLEDCWYYLSQSGLQLIVSLGTDTNLECIDESTGVLDTGTATIASTVSTVVDSGKSWTTNRWANYRVRITAGTALGENAVILSNDGTTLTTLTPFLVAPDATSTYEIIPDSDKNYWMNAGAGNISQYSKEIDNWSWGRIYDSGVANIGSASFGGQGVIALSSITRSGVTATATTVLNHNFKVGDSVTIAGATHANYNGAFAVVSVPSLTTFTYTMIGDPGANATLLSAVSSTVIPDSSKNWVVNSLAGKIIIYYTGATSLQTNSARTIISNTANTITVTQAVGAGGANGASRYVITDGLGFGYASYGTCSGAGTSTTLNDAAQSWSTNQYVGHRVRVISGTGSNEMTITANTATSLTFAGGSATDTTSRYVIYGVSPRSVGFSFIWADNATYPTSAAESKGRYIYSFRGGTIPGIDRYDISSMQWFPLQPIPSVGQFTTGSQYTYDGVNTIYMEKDSTQRMFRYNIGDNSIEPTGTAPFPGATAVAMNRFEIINVNGLIYLYFNRHSSQEFFRCLQWW